MLLVIPSLNFRKAGSGVHAPVEYMLLRRARPIGQVSGGTARGVEQRGGAEPLLLFLGGCCSGVGWSLCLCCPLQAVQCNSNDVSNHCGFNLESPPKGCHSDLSFRKRPLMPVLGSFELRAVQYQDNEVQPKEELKERLLPETPRTLILGSRFSCCFNFSFAPQEYL